MVNYYDDPFAQGAGSTSSMEGSGAAAAGADGTNKLDPEWLKKLLSDLLETATPGVSADTAHIRTSIEQENEFNRVLDREIAEARRKFDTEQNELDRLAKSADAQGDRTLQYWIQGRREKLAADRERFEWQVQEMRANVTLRGQNIDAAIAQVRSFVDQRGQDVTQRGQDMNAQVAMMDDQRARLELQGRNLQYLGEYKLAAEKFNQAADLERRTAALQSSETFGYARPGQAALLQSVMQQRVAPQPPDFSRINAGLQQQPTISAPRVGPTPMPPGDIAGGLGPALFLQSANPSTPVLPPDSVTNGAPERVMYRAGAR